jgi:hypothetical protein
LCRTQRNSEITAKQGPTANYDLLIGVRLGRRFADADLTLVPYNVSF